MHLPPPLRHVTPVHACAAVPGAGADASRSGMWLLGSCTLKTLAGATMLSAALVGVASPSGSWASSAARVAVSAPGIGVSGTLPRPALYVSATAGGPEVPASGIAMMLLVGG